MAYGIFLGSLRNRSGHSGHPGANISSSLSVERTDCAEYSIFKVLKYFLLYTVSVRRATVKSGRVIGPSKFLSTPSVRRATGGLFHRTAALAISIHALRAEGDREQKRILQKADISIHALRAEGDMQGDGFFEIRSRFLSTPSVRRATGHSRHRLRLYRISIHALRAEGDSWSYPSVSPASDFYPRPPCGGRRVVVRITAAPVRISIHALRAEGDRYLIGCASFFGTFLSTPSVRRATQASQAVFSVGKRFLSTPSVRRATGTRCGEALALQ